MSFHKPLPLKLSPKARQDFIDILRYTSEKWGQQQLLVYRAKIDDALQAIRHNPQLGHGRDDLPPTYQAYLVGSHVIVYRVDAYRRCSHPASAHEPGPARLRLPTSLARIPVQAHEVPRGVFVGGGAGVAAELGEPLDLWWGHRRGAGTRPR
jgi:toxin ParE1/3/4